MSSHWLKTQVAVLAICFASPILRAAELTVFAAASLTESLKAIASVYERKCGDRIVFNFGASSMLARQIEEGAPADIFFSADEARMDTLEAKGLIVKETRKSRLSNVLVIVVATKGGPTINNPNELTMARVKRLALAEPRTVPAGIYAKEYLQKQKLWSAVESKVIPTENVRAALAAVEAGTYEVPRPDNPNISYPMAMVKETRQPEAAKQLLQYLDSDDAARVFERFGFIIRR